MDYSLITEDKIRARMRSLSPDITDLLNSQIATRTVERIGREHSMDAERVEMLQQLVGLVFLGFLSTKILAEEINENLRLNHRHSQEVTKDLESRVFEQVSKDLEKLYEPLADIHNETSLERDEEPSFAKATEGEEERGEKLETRKDTIYLEKLGPEPVRPKVVRPEVKLPEEHKKDKGYGGARPAVFGKKKVDDGGEKPLILHEEKSPSAVGKKRKRPLGSLSFSLGRFFNKEGGGEKGETPVPKAEVEIPVSKDTKHKKQDDKKIVHYSEHKTSFGKSAPKGELMNLSKLVKNNDKKTDDDNKIGRADGKITNDKITYDDDRTNDDDDKMTNNKTNDGKITNPVPATRPPANLSRPNDDDKANDDDDKKESGGAKLEGNTVDLR